MKYLKSNCHFCRKNSDGTYLIITLAAGGNSIERRFTHPNTEVINKPSHSKEFNDAMRTCLLSFEHSVNRFKDSCDKQSQN